MKYSGDMKPNFKPPCPKLKPPFRYTRICSGENENDFLWPRGVRSLPVLQEDGEDHDPTLLFIDRISTQLHCT